MGKDGAGRRGRGQTKSNCGLDKGDSGRDNVKWLDSKCSLKVKLTEQSVQHH